MSEELVIEQCSPTLAGLKTGSLFSYFFQERAELFESLRRFNYKLVPHGLRLIPVKITEDRALIYMYRPDRLKIDFKDRIASSILSERFYPTDKPEKCVIELIKRLKDEEDFPHEIGLFLGYPAYDVQSFIKLGAHGAKCVGTWKAYGNIDAAKKKFALYKKCTRLYKEAYKKEKSFDKLIVEERSGMISTHKSNNRDEGVA